MSNVQRKNCGCSVCLGGVKLYIPGSSDHGSYEHLYETALTDTDRLNFVIQKMKLYVMHMDVNQKTVKLISGGCKIGVGFTDREAIDNAIIRGTE